ncbi:MAG: DUF3368 domain-containing protein [Chloroflexia bacterium]
MAVPDRPVVSNTTPLINLVGIGRLDLMHALYGTIWIPNVVYEEYGAGRGSGDPDVAALAWVRIVPTVAPDPSLPQGLGAGEAAAISLAIAENARAVLLDEQLARRVARERGLPIVGTLGLLVAAKQSGILPAVKPLIDLMIAQGRHISGSLRAQVLQAAGEEA